LLDKPLSGSVYSLGEKLTSNSETPQGSGLTNRNRPFVVCFKYHLPKDFCFTKLEKQSIKDFQSFLDKVSSMTFHDAKELYEKQPDALDVYNEMPVVHYKVTDRFRLHGVVEDGEFCVIRLDPNHKFHK